MSKLQIVAGSWLILAALSVAAVEPMPEKQAVLAFAFEATGQAKGEQPKPPFFRVFPGGKDAKGRDASGTLKTLKLARGASKLYPQEDEKPGLIVVLRR